MMTMIIIINASDSKLFGIAVSMVLARFIAALSNRLMSSDVIYRSHVRNRFSRAFIALVARRKKIRR